MYQEQLQLQSLFFQEVLLSKTKINVFLTLIATKCYICYLFLN